MFMPRDQSIKEVPPYLKTYTYFTKLIDKIFSLIYYRDDSGPKSGTLTQGILNMQKLLRKWIFSLLPAAAILFSTEADAKLVQKKTKKNSHAKENMQTATLTTPGYGPLTPTAAENYPNRILLSLPAGFTYRIIDETGDIMSDGSPQPAATDGMAIFNHPTNPQLWRVIRNHELGAGASLGDINLAYDPAAQGSMVMFDLDSVNLMESNKFVVASGFVWPCSGGATPSPTNSWIGCEEATTLQANANLEEKHGYCFEIPSTLTEQIVPEPLKAMGRFVHEAAVVDPETGIVYLTEDDTPAGFYRFIPNNRYQLSAGGTLQMLKIVGQYNYDTRKHQQIGAELDVEWVTIANADPDIENQGNDARVVKQGINLGAAIFDYLEGEDFKNGSVTFVSSYGGTNNHGQVWRYTPSTNKLRLLYEPKNRQPLDSPDNCAVSPRGGVVVCEDGTNKNYLRGLTSDDQIFDFAMNIEGNDGEFSSPVYTPDGKWLIVSLYTPGITIAITGPWGTEQLQ